MKILCSCSNHKSDKTVSTGFKTKMYDTLEELADAMMKSAHSSSVYSTMIRWNKYNQTWAKEQRRRLHNISLIGNLLAYDFDDGSLTFKGAKKIAKKIVKDNGFEVLLIKSKSDPKSNHDRFKMIIVTNELYPKYHKDEVEPGFNKVAFESYKDTYKGVAKLYGFNEYMDKSTNDPSRLIAQVTTDNKKDKRREYVIVR